MAVDASVAGALRRRLALQERLWAAAHPTVLGRQNHVSGRRLHHEIRAYLLKASDSGLLKESNADIHRSLLAVPGGAGYFEIAVGRVRNFNRDVSLPHYTRRDGAWFDFQVMVKECGATAEIVAYDFELRLPTCKPFEFVRLDLNPPGSENQGEGLRSHLHLNSDDDGVSIPAPVMSPLEILDLFIHGVRQIGRNRRSPVQTQDGSDVPAVSRRRQDDEDIP